jgi:DNA repair protein RecN (Recombination protein N)
MLRNLTIDNYALISHLEMQFSPGFTVMTGETGAGKSIIMGALSLILGGRADSKTVRSGTGKCVVEAVFDITGYDLSAFFAASDLEYEPSATIIRREVTAAGKSRAFINDTPVLLPQLKSLGERLIDIHSQHQNLMLGTDTFQQEVIDALAHDDAELGRYRESYRALTDVRRQIADLRAEAQRTAREADYMRFQWQQLSAAKLDDEEEQTRLEDEQSLLSHAEEIKSSLAAISNSLQNEDANIVAEVTAMARNARRLESVYPAIHELAERLEADAIDLADIARDVENQTDRISFDPQRMEEVESRLDLIYSLQKKHGADSVAALIALRDDLGARLQQLEGSDARLDELAAREKELLTATRHNAEALSAARRKAASAFEKDLIDKVAYLGMPNVRFEVQIESLDDFSPSGADSITFLFSANRRQPLLSIGQVASGGEISRLMLSIKALIASARMLPTIVFDEIDTGVSGPTADRMGEVMADIADHIQVITITHLPQVASKGDTHYYIYKEDEADDTQTHITRLNGKERIGEIARLLSGSALTPEAIANAKALLTAKK